MQNTLDTILAYHQRTKHQLQRYAAGPGELDWKNQPAPFRIFSGSPQLQLPLQIDTQSHLYTDLYKVTTIAPQPLAMVSLAAMLECSLGISAWKQYGNSRWALRCNPSSGNLHPTEAYVIVAGCAGIQDGVYHYVSRDHLLERRCGFTVTQNKATTCLPPDSFLLGLTSIHWREAWKYGERAYRYCQHDAGHAIAAVRYAAATLGWQVQVLSSWGDAAIGAMLGVDRAADFGAAEREHPDVMLLVTAQPMSADIASFTPGTLLHVINQGSWQGQANILSAQHQYDWPVIEDAAQACHKPATQQAAWQVPTLPAPINSACTQSALAILQQRRSAQSFDGVSSITANTFYRMLDMTLPRAGVPPWDVMQWQPRIHLALFVHRVDGLAPGLYVFLRNQTIATTLRTELSAEFEWQQIEDCPAHFSLFRLVHADARDAARALSCHQDIAADGAFSLGMLAEYETSLAQGPWWYRHLFWEAGMLGHVLYLEAEAAGVRGTGIGCYFDDAVHEVLGIKNTKLQSLYHFTVGTALTDDRLQTLPPYAGRGA